MKLTQNSKKEFHVAYVFIKMANSPRPGVWELQKSSDNGLTWQTWQYFAETQSDCLTFFNTTATEIIERDDQVICTNKYSQVNPMEGGEILVSLVNNRPNAKNFTHSDVLQNWTRATNVRLKLLRTKTLLSHMIYQKNKKITDHTVTRRVIEETNCFYFTILKSSKCAVLF
jgi:laminin alpha 3/5